MRIYKPFTSRSKKIKGKNAKKRRKLARAAESEAYDKSKLKQAGLWDQEKAKSKLTVVRLSDKSGLTADVPPVA